MANKTHTFVIKNYELRIKRAYTLRTLSILGTLNSPNTISRRGRLRTRTAAKLPIQENLIPDIAVEAVVGLAVVLIEVEQGLGVGGVVHLLPQQLPLADDAVVLRRYLLYQQEGLLCRLHIVVIECIGVLIGYHAVNQ